MSRGHLAVLMLGTLLVAGCTVGAGTPAHSLGVIKLGVDLPLSGDDAPDGLPARNAIDLAVKQAGRVCGPSRHPDACFDLQAVTYDDDSVATSELPVANAARLTMVSPGTTNECLSQEPPDGHCQGLSARLRPGGPNNFFRVVTTQLVEGAAAADLAFRALGKKRAFLIKDQTTFGLGIATAFSARFVRDGGTIVDPSDLGAFDPNQPPAFGSRVQRALEVGADVIYFAGTSISTAASLRREMATRMPQVPLIGSDRLASSQFAKAAGAAARGSYYTVVGPYPAVLRGAQAFMHDYKTAYGHDVGAFSLPAYDATKLLIAGIGRAIDDAGGALPTRDQVLKQVSATRDYRGAMGAMSFDARGDTNLKLLTAYQWLGANDAAGQFVAQPLIDG